MKVAARFDRTHNPFDEIYRVSRLRENLTSGSEGEGLETGLRSTLHGHAGGNPGYSQGHSYGLPRQSFTRQVDLRFIKEVMQMDVLRGKTPVMVSKEIAVHLLAYNLIRTVIAQAAQRYNRLPRAISFKATVQLLSAFQAKGLLDTAASCRACYESLLGSLIGHRIGNRPGRTEPRAVKRRSGKYPFLTKPRPQARAELVPEASCA